MNSISDNLVIDLAKDLIATMRASVPGWKKAFIRFEASDNHSGVKGSYVTSDGVFILDVFEFKPFVSRTRSRGIELRDALENKGRRFCLFLLSADSDFQYNIEFEWSDPDKWKISKMDGASGIPEGLENA